MDLATNVENFPMSGSKVAKNIQELVKLLPYSKKFSRGQISAYFRAEPQLREIARKLVLNFFTYAHEKNRDEFSQNLPLFFVCISMYQVFEISKSEGARK